MKKFTQGESLKKISQHLKILYIEDEDALRRSTANIFIKFFNHVDTAVDGREGLALYKKYFADTKKYYDIVISDIKMPHLDGISMSKTILEIHKEQKIIIISAYEEKRYLLDMINLGIEGFLQKPFEYRQMLKVLYKVCITFEFDNLQYFKALTESSIVSKSDVDGIITYVNDNFCNITGYAREDMIGRSHNIFRCSDNPDFLYQELWKTISSGNIWRGRMTNLNKDGSAFIAETTIIPLLAQDGTIKEYMALRNDITDIINLKRNIFAKEQEHKREEDIKKAQKSFLLIFTHELKTPLNAIINFSKYIKKQIEKPKELNKEKLLTLLDSVLNNASDMLDNITQILEISKLSSGKLSYNQTLFSANELILHTIEKFDSLFEGKNIELIYQVNPNIFIYSDEQRVKQIISNVLSNAIKYGKDKITIKLYSMRDIVKISIEDNGSGIKDKEAIFNLYTQEDENLLERKGTGTGIGLHFVKLLCKDLDIRYNVENADENSGSRFIFTFKNR